MDKTGLSKENLDKKVEAKMQELSGLLSPEGAAHIIANELGVDILPSPDEPVTIGNIYEGMRNITLDATLLQRYDLVEFERNGRKGKVRSAVVGDSTGRIRISFWHDAADMLNDLKEGETYRITGLTARTNRGRVELSSTNPTTIEESAEKIDTAIIPQFRDQEPRRVFIKDAQPESYGTVVGALVQVFSPVFYEVCPECQKRVRKKGDVFMCDEHGEIEEDFSYVLNAVIDDGTATIRSVFFRDQAAALLDFDDKQMQKLRRSDSSEFQDIKDSALGELVKVSGRFVSNEMFGRTELISSRITKDIDVEKEVEAIRAL